MQAIDWSLVERRVAERFAQIGQPKDAPLPTRLAVSLAIFNYKTGHLPEDAPHAWSTMPIYQFLSGATHYKMELPCDPQSWRRSSIRWAWCLAPGTSTQSATKAFL